MTDTALCYTRGVKINKQHSVPDIRTASFLRRLRSQQNERSQAGNQRIAMIVRHQAFAKEVDERCQLFPAGPSRSDLSRPHDNLGGTTCARRTLVDDLTGQMDNAVSR
jgi:hypothetical protein